MFMLAGEAVSWADGDLLLARQNSRRRLNSIILPGGGGRASIFGGDCSERNDEPVGCAEPRKSALLPSREPQARGLRSSTLGPMPRLVPSIALRAACLVSAAVILLAGCRTPEEQAFIQPPRSDAPPRYLLVGRAGSTNVTAEHRVVVEDAAFVRELFVTLSQPSTNRYEQMMWIPSRPFIFVDEHRDVCRGFMYLGFSRPPSVFRPCWVERRGDDYVVTKREYNSDLAIPGFDEKFRRYLNVWNPDVP